MAFAYSRNSNLLCDDRLPTLMQIWTGRKPTKRTFEVLSYYSTGLTSEEVLLAHFAKLREQDEAKQKHS